MVLIHSALNNYIALQCIKLIIPILTYIKITMVYSLLTNGRIGNQFLDEVIQAHFSFFDESCKKKSIYVRRKSTSDVTDSAAFQLHEMSTL